MKARHSFLVFYMLVGLACSEPAGSPTDCNPEAVEQRVRFETSSVPFGGQCSTEVQTRTCAGGRWSEWSGTFIHAACTANEPRQCQEPPAEHGARELRRRYEKAQVSFGETCQIEEQARKCWDGAWSAWSGTFEAQTCTDAEPPPCTDPVAGHGAIDQRIRFAAQQVPFGQVCQPEDQSRTCWNGAWSAWSGIFAHDTCTVSDPLPCQDPGAPHGTTSTRTRYVAPSVPYGSSCQSEEQTRTCWSGTWSPWSGTYEHDACVVPVIVAIRIIPANPVLEGSGAQYPFHALGIFDIGGELEITSLATWSSTDAAIVTFSGAPGIATGHMSGSATVRATLDGVQAEVVAVVRNWSYEIADTYDYGAIDFAGDQHGRVIVGWGYLGSAPGLELVKVKAWNDQWLATTLVAEHYEEVLELSVAINQRGDQHVLWTIGNLLRARNWDSVTGLWSTVGTLTNGAEYGVPRLALAHVGHALATWPEAGAQYYSAFSVQDGWSTSGTWLAGRRSYDVAVDVLGNGIVLASDTWMSPTIGAAIYAYHYVRATDSVGPRITVYETDNTSSPYEGIEFPARLGMDALGNAIVVWVRDLYNQNAVMAARYIAGEGWLPAEVIIEVGNSQILLGNLSVHPSGTAAVAFSSPYGGNGHRVFAATYTPTSGWDVPTPLSSPGKHVSLVWEQETIATAYGGRAIAVWSEPLGAGVYTLAVRRYDPEDGWRPPSYLDTASSFAHESAFGLQTGFFVGYVAHTDMGSLIASAVFR